AIVRHNDATSTIRTIIILTADLPPQGTKPYSGCTWTTILTIITLSLKNSFDYFFLHYIFLRASLPFKKKQLSITPINPGKSVISHDSKNNPVVIG
ncbi:hypothetical protein, partial [uncultured Duncaniella sp.]|uniref:hypothetical protein n=1 Tax=uncultured Duncaniella sp. TaxID=2768039 RepID=UPI0025B6A176